MPRIMKTWQEKLQASNGLPIVKPLSDRMMEKYGAGTLLVPSPLDVDEAMRSVPEGKLITTDVLRAQLARRYGATQTCPLVTGISVRIAANASEERQQAGQGPVTPYWRTLKTGGELNEKLPGGIEHQRRMLEHEGHTIVQRGHRYFVSEFEHKRVD